MERERERERRKNGGRAVGVGVVGGAADIIFFFWPSDPQAKQRRQNSNRNGDERNPFTQTSCVNRDGHFSADGFQSVGQIESNLLIKDSVSLGT